MQKTIYCNKNNKLLEQNIIWTIDCYNEPRTLQWLNCPSYL